MISLQQRQRRPPLDSETVSFSIQFAQGIRDTWKKVYAEWFDGSGYVYDEDGLDFEYYDERCHHTAHSVMDIYIPVKKVPTQQNA